MHSDLESPCGTSCTLVDDSSRLRGGSVNCTAGFIVQVATFRDNTISIGPPGKPR